MDFRQSKLSERGVSLLESLIIVVTLAGIVFLMANLPNALNLMNKSKHISLAREIAVKQVEDKRATSYLNLVPDTTNISDNRLSLLPNGSGTVTISDCDISICTQGEHLKKIAVLVKWKDNGKDQEVSLNTFIGEGGLDQ